MKPVIYKEIDSVTRIQIRQLHNAKRLPRGERHNAEVITYTHTTISQKDVTVTHTRHNHETAPISPVQPSEANIKELFETCLNKWEMTLTAPLLNGIFFKDYRQAYNALRKAEELGYVENHDGQFVKV